MKRIYITFALVGSIAANSFSQDKIIDLQAGIGFPLSDAAISPNQSLDTTQVLAGIFYTGPGDIIMDEDAVYFMSSFSTPADDSLTYLDGVSFTQDLLGDADTGLIFRFPNDQEIGKGHTGPFTLTSDSIRGLYDWDQWSQNNTPVLIRPPMKSVKLMDFSSVLCV